LYEQELARYDDTNNFYIVPGLQLGAQFQPVCRGWKKEKRSRLFFKIARVGFSLLRSLASSAPPALLDSATIVINLEKLVSTVIGGGG